MTLKDEPVKNALRFLLTTLAQTLKGCITRFNFYFLLFTLHLNTSRFFKSKTALNCSPILSIFTLALLPITSTTIPL